MPQNLKTQALLALSAVLLGGCGMLDTTRKIEKPPVKLLSGVGAALTVTDEQSGNPVELGREQQLIVRLRYAGSTQSDWTLVGFEPGVLKEIGTTRYEQDTTAAAYGEVAGTQIWRFQPTGAGQVALRFELRAPRSREPAIGSASYSVTVR